MDNFGIPLCMPHQKGKEKKVETRDEKISDLLRATPEALQKLLPRRHAGCGFFERMESFVKFYS